MSIPELDMQKQADEILEDARFELARIANALKIVGNLELSAKLFWISKDIDKGRNLMNDASRMSIDKAFKASQEATGNMISACLAVASIKSKSDITEEEE